MDTDTEVKKLRNDVVQLQRQVKKLEKDVEYLMKMDKEHYPNDSRRPVF